MTDKNSFSRLGFLLRGQFGDDCFLGKRGKSLDSRDFGVQYIHTVRLRIQPKDRQICFCSSMILVRMVSKKCVRRSRRLTVVHSPTRNTDLNVRFDFSYKLPSEPLEQISLLKHTPLFSTQPSSIPTTFKLDGIHRPRRHLLLGLLRLLGVQLYKRHMLLRHHQSCCTLIIREVRISSDVSTLQFTPAGSARLVLALLHQHQCQGEYRSKSEDTARDAYTCLGPGAEVPCLVGVAARLWGRIVGAAAARLSCRRRGWCSCLRR